VTPPGKAGLFQMFHGTQPAARAAALAHSIPPWPSEITSRALLVLEMEKYPSWIEFRRV
jgi:hypothetical protein